MSPLNKNDRGLQDKDLPNTEAPLDRKTDSKNSNKAENQAQNLPPDLAEIVAVWLELPEHIKQSIKALVQACKVSQSRQGQALTGSFFLNEQL